jgi:hypothetical protein
LNKGYSLKSPVSVNTALSSVEGWGRGGFEVSVISSLLGDDCKFMEKVSGLFKFASRIEIRCSCRTLSDFLVCEVGESDWGVAIVKASGGFEANGLWG